MQGWAGQGRGEVELGEVPWRWLPSLFVSSLALPGLKEARGRPVWKPVTTRSALFASLPKRENFTIHVEI